MRCVLACDQQDVQSQIFHHRWACPAMQVISTMANPMLCPTYSVVLRRLQLALPIKLHELLLSMGGAKQALPLMG